MAEVVGSYQRSTFTTPVNGTTTDATTVLGNDNDIRSSHNSHDAEAGVHLQGSTLAARPGAAAAGAGAKWLTTDGLRIYYSDGASWSEVAYLPLAGGTVTGATTFSAQSVHTLGLTTPAQITSTVATGTAPFVIASTTVSANLNADMVDGQHAAAFATAVHSHVLRGELPAAIAYEDEANSFSGAQTFTGQILVTSGGTAELLYLTGNVQGADPSALRVGTEINANNGASGQFILIGGSVATGKTYPEIRGVRIINTTETGTGAITQQVGLLIDDLTSGATNYSIYTGTAASRFGGAIIAKNGTNLAPSYVFQQDQDSGFWSPADGSVGLAINAADVWKWTSGQHTMPDGVVATPALSFAADPDTGFYRTTAGQVSFAANGSQILTIGPDAVSAQPFIRIQAADGGAGSAGFAFTNDSSTGLYRPAAATLAVTVNGVQTAQLDKADTDTHTTLLVLVNRAAVKTLDRVTIGAADSGGVGFRVLRVPN